MDYIATARSLAKQGQKPSQVRLRRALSTAYYALFHTVSKCCADVLVGGTSAARSDSAWRQVYRALEHGLCKSACQHKTIMPKFPKEIEDFANAFVTMQQKRHSADYDPFAVFSRSEVLVDIDVCEQNIKDFNVSKMKDRRAFAAHVLFKQPRS